MAATLFDAPDLETLADLQKHLGEIPAWRIRLRPAPGTAKVKDVLAIYKKEKRLFELVDGVLVEKAMSFKASWLAIVLARYLLDFVEPWNLGLVAGEAGMVRLKFDLVRIPDVCFVSWDRIPGGKVPDEPIPKLAPNLAVEVLSDSNTPAEMKRKRREYFKAGVSLVWTVDPETRTVVVHTSVKKFKTLTEAHTLDGGAVLPGFTLSLQKLFAALDLKAPA